jgi:hypothetical protein
MMSRMVMPRQEPTAHSPVMEEPQKAQKIMREDVLAGTNSLADGSRR